MKLRMRGGSVRLRLTRSEVTLFKEVGRIEERVEFGALPSQRLVYVLESSIEVEEINASYQDQCIFVRVPQELAGLWANTDRIGIEGRQALGEGLFLRILIEKDFACLERSDSEDESDAYPHPDAGKAC